MTMATGDAGRRSTYQELGISATKDDVHRAIRHLDAGLFPGAFCRVGPDVFTGDPDYCCALHSDDAGTKALVAYLHYKETGDATVFRGIAQDALVMNLDDLACVGATERFLLGNTINRNSSRVGGDVIAEVIAGYEDCCRRWKPLGIDIVATGGETADMNDSVRTIVVGATLATRLRRDQVVDNARIRPGDAIIGLSSTGQATYEDGPNSGIGDNGLTLARHALLHRDYRDRFPETVDPDLDPNRVYRGPHALADRPTELGMTVRDALLSPTRTYAPIVARAVNQVGREAIHGVVHCTGGGQTKCRGFSQGVRYLKNNLFEIPPLFQLIARHGGVEWREMYQTFNMGHRIELMVDPAAARTILDIAAEFSVEAKVVGQCEPAERNEVVIESSVGRFNY